MKRDGAQFSRRERQIMDALYTLGEGGAAEVADLIGDTEAYDSIRVTLGILERNDYPVVSGHNHSRSLRATHRDEGGSR